MNSLHLPATRLQVGSLTLEVLDSPHNAAIRQVYHARTSAISSLNDAWLAQGVPLNRRAEHAYALRHEARLSARRTMPPEEVQELRARDLLEYGNPNGPTFAALVERAHDLGHCGSEVYESILDGAVRTNPVVDRLLLNTP
jgi:hypothetical protein